MSDLDYRSYRCLIVEKRDRVALLTFNRPESLNAFNSDIFYEFVRVLDDLEHDDEVYSVAVTGAGRAFCSGGDVKQMLGDAKFLDSAITIENWRKLAYKMVDFEKPLIAAVNGDAVGGGSSILFLFDFIYAVETARIGELHSRLGLVPPCGPALLPSLIGMMKAKKYLMLGDIMGAREAERIGLVTEVVPLDQLLPTALETARRLAYGPKAMRWTKFCINKHLRDVMNLVFDTSTAYEWLAADTADHREAVQAFVEKRKPTFVGR